MLIQQVYPSELSRDSRPSIIQPSIIQTLIIQVVKLRNDIHNDYWCALNKICMIFIESSLKMYYFTYPDYSFIFDQRCLDNGGSTVPDFR